MLKVFLDSLRAVCKETDDPKRHANRHVEGQQLPSEKRMVYQIESLPVIEQDDPNGGSYTISRVFGPGMHHVD